MATPVRNFGLREGDRLRGKTAFEAVYFARVRKNVGPITVCGRPNDLGGPRMGLSVPRGVGTAVKRNRIKRLIREAYRLGKHEWPGAYDVVVVVRGHEPASLGDYQRMLADGVRGLHVEWERRKRREGGGTESK